MYISSQTPPIIIRRYLQIVCSLSHLSPFFPKTHANKMQKQSSLHHTLRTFSLRVSSGCKTLLLPFRFPSGFPYSLSVSVPPPFRSLHSYIGNAFHKHARKPYPICLTPQRMSKATALPRKLAKEQRRYRESLASSISNIAWVVFTGCFKLACYKRTPLPDAALICTG